MDNLTIEQAAGELKAMKEHIEPYMSVVGVSAYDMAIECIDFTAEVLGILGTFGLSDIYVRKEILDYLFKHKDKYKNLCMLWDQIVGNFS